MKTHFAKDYGSARDLFRRAAELRAAELRSYPIPARGPRQEELAIDTAYVGPTSARRLLIVTSGTHGVEGYAGAAIQHQLLSDQLDGLDLPADCGLLLIHAVNPYGFAHTRRVNESNVDLNRNFLHHPDEHADNREYDLLYDAVNPSRFDDENEMASRVRLLEFAREHGFPRLQFTLTCGQYKHPRGMQFGGFDEEASNLEIRRILREQQHEASAILWLDLHTGLGPYGDYELVSQYRTDDPGYLRGREWFGEKLRTTLSGESISSRLFGDMIDGAVAELSGAPEIVTVAPEFGTYDANRVFYAMRADNWLQHHGDLDSPQGRQIKAELLEVFRPSDPAWQNQILAGGARVIQQARDGLRR